MNRDLILGATLVLAACITATAFLVKEYRQFHLAAPSPRVAMAPPEPIAPPVPPAPKSFETSPVAAPPTQPSAPAAPPPLARTNPAAQRGPRRGAAPAAPAKIDEPHARQALELVGADPDAEAVWVSAINDATLAPNDRRNLIEDLNETGFADPRNLTANDLPLIEARLSLIEQLAPDALDEVNAAAFQEAYKDLVNMYNRLTGN